MLHMGPGFKVTPLRTEDRRDPARIQLRPSSPPRWEHHKLREQRMTPSASALGTSPPKTHATDAVQPGMLARDYYEETASFLSNTRALLEGRPESLTGEALHQYQDDSKRWLANYNRLTTCADKAFITLHGVVLHMSSQLERHGGLAMSEAERGDALRRVTEAERVLETEMTLEATQQAAEVHGTGTTASY